MDKITFRNRQLRLSGLCFRSRNAVCESSTHDDSVSEVWHCLEWAKGSEQVVRSAGTVRSRCTQPEVNWSAREAPHPHSFLCLSRVGEQKKRSLR